MASFGSLSLDTGSACFHRTMILLLTLGLAIWLVAVYPFYRNYILGYAVTCCWRDDKAVEVYS